MNHTADYSNNNSQNCLFQILLFYFISDQDMFVLIILASACLALCITLFAVSRRKTPNKSPPGPCGLPFFGTSLSIDTKNIHLEFDNWNGEYGDIFVTKLMGKNVCVISNPNLIRKAFESEEFSPFMSDRSPNFMGTYVAYGYKDVLLRQYDDTLIQMKKIMVDAINHYGFNNPHYVENVNIELKDVVSQFRNTNSEPMDPLDILMPSFCNLIAMFVSISFYFMGFITIPTVDVFVIVLYLLLTLHLFLQHNLCY